MTFGLFDRSGEEPVPPRPARAFARMPGPPMARFVRDVATGA